MLFCCCCRLIKAKYYPVFVLVYTSLFNTSVPGTVFVPPYLCSGTLRRQWAKQAVRQLVIRNTATHPHSPTQEPTNPTTHGPTHPLDYQSTYPTCVAPPTKKCHFADFLHKSTTGSTPAYLGIFLVRHSVALPQLEPHF